MYIYGVDRMIRRSPAPAGINRAGCTTTFIPGTHPPARGDPPITDNMPVMFPRQRASTSLMPVSDRRAAPSPLTAGITTQEKFQRAPARFHHPAPAGIRPRKNRLSNVKTAAPRLPRDRTRKVCQAPACPASVSATRRNPPQIIRSIRPQLKATPHGRNQGANAAPPERGSTGIRGLTADGASP